MNGRAWTGKEVWQLMTLAETVSQQEAARRLNRSVQAVNTKSKYLGVRWRRGLVSLNTIARNASCSPTTARDAAKDFGFKRIGQGNGRRYLLTTEQASWLEEHLKKRLSRNRQNQDAGRQRWHHPHIHTTQPNPAASLSENQRDVNRKGDGDA